jgi:NADH-quinone oxidoreductase subunit C
VTDSKDRKENGEASEKKPAEQNQPVEKAEAAPAEAEKEKAAAGKGDSEKKETAEKKDARPTDAPGKEKPKKAPARPAAKGARGAARKKKVEEPPEPSPKQPLLDAFVNRITEQVGKEAVEESYINRPNGHLPTIVVKSEKWRDVARLLREDENLSFDYLMNVSGVDYEDRMEVVYHFESLTHKHRLCVRVKTDRDDPTVPSVTDLWIAADWDEREIYDLFGIRFPGHPNLKRILLPENWVGHPLRKDYEPADPDI